MKNLTTNQVKRMLSDPFYCITVNPIYCQPHEYLVDKKTWIEAQKVAIKEIGLDAYFKLLLSVLEKGQNA